MARQCDSYTGLGQKKVFLSSPCSMSTIRVVLQSIWRLGLVFSKLSEPTLWIQVGGFELVMGRKGASL